MDQGGLAPPFLDKTMIHLKPSETALYVYAGTIGLTGFEISLKRKKGRSIETIVLPLTVEYFGNMFYKLVFNTAPTLEEVEYDYEITANGALIDKGILRYGLV